MNGVEGKEDESPNHTHKIEEFSLQPIVTQPQADESVSSGFVINPENESVSIITDDFASLAASETSNDTPLAQIIGRFNFFSGARKRILSNDSKLSYDLSRHTTDKFTDNPKNISRPPVLVQTNRDVSFEVDLGRSMDIPDSATYPPPKSRPSSPTRIYRKHSERNAVIDLSVDLSREEVRMQALGEPMNFTKDDPTTMTYGRRFALNQMSSRWYNPNAITKKVLPMADEDEEIEVELESVDENPMRERKRANAMDIAEAVALELGNFNRTMDEIESPSLERAWGYFEHVTLPRYINSFGEKFPQGCCDKFHLLKSKLEKAEPGERYLRSKLYDPMFTALDQMGDFGLGVGLYFATLRAVMAVTLVAGLVCLPNMIHFSGPDYSNRQEGVYWALKGSAICTNVSFVPCVNCTSDMFRGNEDRFRTFLSQDGDELPFGLKNNCNTKLTVGLYSLVAAFMIILGMVATSYYLQAMEKEFDEDEHTTQDFSIKILNPPSNAHDPDEWKRFFRKRFKSQVTLCTITVNNTNLVERLVQRREILQNIKSIIGPNESLGMENLRRLAASGVAKRNLLQKGWARLSSGIPEKYLKLLDCEEEIKTLSSQRHPVVSVFITFEQEAAQRKVLSIMQTTDGYDEKYCFRKGYFLKVIEPAEPSGIIWEDLDESKRMYLRYFLTTVTSIGLVVAAAFLVKEARTYGPNEAAYTISILNFVFPMIAKRLTNMEIHRNFGSKQTSLFTKITLFRWVNTAIVTTIITPFTSTLMNGEDSLIAGVYAIFFAEIVINSGLQILDFGGNLNRHFFAPRQKTQEDMNQCMGGAGIELAERYANMTKLFFLSLWYCPIYPGALFLCSFSLYVNYYIDRFSLMRTWAPIPKLSSEISKINRSYFIPGAIGVMSVISSYMWAHFNFDNLCPVESSKDDYVGTWTSIDTDGSQSTLQVITDNFTSYKYCNQDMLGWGTSFTFPALPYFQPTDARWMWDEQETVTLVWGWASVAILSFIAIFYAMSIKNHFFVKFKPKGKIENVKLTDLTDICAYVPQLKSPEIPYPLITCPVSHVQTRWFAWSSPYHDHSYYDLTLDAETIMKTDERGRVVNKNAFSKAIQWVPA